eukprot:comp20694_c0_seq1/m.26961 comp20694_c0_seq1/g.26961  ORF comp20694_c0_seq1/g.26961 comp20694_c0_seq1/m.26961 type:complete len:372 (-) comp20694_c0_seq1:388-1503(-)
MRIGSTAHIDVIEAPTVTDKKWFLKRPRGSISELQDASVNINGKAAIIKEFEVACAVFPHPNLILPESLVFVSEKSEGAAAFPAIRIPFFDGAPLARFLQDRFRGKIRSSCPWHIAHASVEMTMWQLLLQVAKGLDHLHSCGVTHFDCHARNILVGYEPGTSAPIAKIIDFGYSQLGDAKVGCAPNRCRNMSPEEVNAWWTKKEMHVDGPECEVYKFGNLVFSLLYQAERKYTLEPGDYFCHDQDDVCCNGDDALHYPKFPTTVDELIESIQTDEFCGSLDEDVCSLFRGVFQNDPKARISMNQVVLAIESILVRMKMKKILSPGIDVQCPSEVVMAIVETERNLARLRQMLEEGVKVGVALWRCGALCGH